MTKLPQQKFRSRARRNEEGGATVKFLIVAVALFVIGHAAFNYLTTWYQCTQFQDSINEAVTRSYSLPSSPINAPDAMRQFIRQKGNENNVPPDAVIKIDKVEGGTRAVVSFTRDVNLLPFNLYKYKYQYNYAAAPPSMLTAK